MEMKSAQVVKLDVKRDRQKDDGDAGEFVKVSSINARQAVAVEAQC